MCVYFLALWLMEVKAIGNMFGLFSTLPYRKGEVVLTIQGEIMDHPLRTSIQIAENVHVDVAAPAKFINHSCAPNTKVEGRNMVALTNISAADEITFDYQSTEDELSAPFVCRDCGEMVKGKRFRGERLCNAVSAHKILETH